LNVGCDGPVASGYFAVLAGTIDLSCAVMETAVASRPGGKEQG
jgi:hypothetical protein